MWWCNCPDWVLFRPDVLPPNHPKSFAHAGRGADLNTTREMSDKQIHQSQAALDALSISRAVTRVKTEDDVPTRVNRPKRELTTLHAGITDIEGLILQINVDEEGLDPPKFFVDGEDDVVTAHPFSTNPKTKPKKKP